MTNKMWKRDVFSNDLAVPAMLAILQLTLQMVFHGNYGYFRDELYFIACSDHLDFGYVDHPPLAIAILWVNRLLLGNSLYAMRFLPSIAGVTVVLLAALTARKLGGGKFAQGLASFSIVAAPGLFGHAQLFSLNSFDVLFWAIASYMVVSLLTDGRPTSWLSFGLVVGLGLLNKYSMAFLVIGLCVGLLLTHERRQFVSRWFWLGGAVATVVFLPHVIWEILRGLPTLEFMRNASMDKNVHLGAMNFLAGQVQNMNYFNAPLWIGGIYYFYRYHEGRYRALAWIYPVVFLIMVLGNGKVYYMSSIYPLYLAGGAVLFEQFVRERSRRWLKPAYVSSLLFSAAISLPFALPFLTVDNFIQYQRLLGITPRADEKFGVAELPQYLSDQFGWKEMVDTVAGVYKKLTPEEQAQCVVYARNYGQAAAIDFFGKEHGLPDAICAHNNYWLWGPGQRTGDIAIIIGWSDRLEENLADLHRYYEHVELAARTTSKYCMPIEKGRLIFVCRGMNTTFQKIWPTERFYI
jgi:4-amino-4-deoxy-L-arabinose transferase-like glycosyltransferase